MEVKNKNVVVPFIATAVIFVVTFILSLIVIGEAELFGVGSPETSPEPMTYAGGLLDYSLLLAIIISLVAFYLFSYYYDLQVFIHLLLIVIMGILGTIIGYILMRTFFDVTNFFVVLHIPPSIRVYNCDNDCLQEVNGLTYSMILGPIIGILTSVLTYVYIKKKKIPSIQ